MALTDPDLYDTDGDGHSDGQEVAARSNPLDPTSVPLIVLLTEAATGHVSSSAATTGFGTLGAISDDGPQPSSGLGYERARHAATADADGDGVFAAWDLDDSDASQTRTTIEDLDEDGIPDRLDDDIDGDGIPNAVDSDDDNDGISDVDELTLHGSDPWNPDSDGDGLRDGSELSLGTDLNDPDSDQDGVNDFDDADRLDADRTYSFGNFPDGDLAPLGFRDQQLNAADVLVAMRMAADASLVSSADLSHGDFDADGSIDIGDAIKILSGSTTDVDGDGLSNSEEFSAGTSPFLADSDFDGLSDYDEVNPPNGTPATDPASRDTDGDGLLDIEELALFTDPNNPDSDGDGIADSRDGQPLDAYVFYHGDHLASTTLLTNMAGVVLSRTLYRPFGTSIEEVGATPEFGFTGQRFEEELEIYDYGARFYDPDIARFLSSDAIVPQYEDPQSLNRYSYVRNNPVNRVDPSGNADHAANQHNIGDAGEEPKVVIVEAEEETGGETTEQSSTNVADSSQELGWDPSFYGAVEDGSQNNPAATDPALDKAVSRAVSAVSGEIRAVNDKNGLLYNRDRANRPLGSVVRKKTVGIPFINQHEVFVNSLPHQFVPDGLDFEADGFIGALQPIRNASAVVVGFSHLTPASSLSSITPSMKALSRSAGAPVFVFFTRGGFKGPFRINSGAEP